MKLANIESNIYLISNNKTIINYTQVYIKEENLNTKNLTYYKPY